MGLLPGTGTAIAALAFSPDGKALAIGGGRTVVVHGPDKPDEKARPIFTLRKSEVLAVAFSPDGKSIAAAGGNVAEKDGLTDLERKIKLLEEARVDKDREVQEKRSRHQGSAGEGPAMNIEQLKDRNTVTFEEYRQLSNELLRVQIEIVKAEAQLAQLQNDQPAGGLEGRTFTDKDVSRLFYADRRVAAARERYDRAKERSESLKDKVRDFADPSHQKPIKDMKAARAELDDLWKELRPEIEAAFRRGQPLGRSGPPRRSWCP